MPLKRFDTSWTPVGGWFVHSRIWNGDGVVTRPDVVLVHGLVVSGQYMEPLAEQLSPHYRVLVPDLPGFGESKNVEHTLTIEELANALAGWMDAVKVQNAILIGNSFGCQIITEFALQRPTRARGVVFIGPTIDPRGRSPFKQASRWLRTALTEPPGLVLTVTKDFFRAGLRRSLKTLRYLLRDRIERKLPNVPVPVLVIRGGHDLVAPRRWAEEIVRLVPRARLVEIPDAAHSPNFAAPETIATLVRDFDRDECSITAEENQSQPD